jgi:hypothetical protein
MHKEGIPSEEWYYEAAVDVETKDREERFPYQIIGTKAKWGSGINTIIYVEDDGKGLLIWTPKKQYYYRTDTSLIEGGN